MVSVVEQSKLHLVDSSNFWRPVREIKSWLQREKDTLTLLRTDCGAKLETAWNFGGQKFTDLADAQAAASALLNDFPIAGAEASDLITAHEFTHDPCRPTLSVPSQILRLDSQWASCAPPLTAFYDPPYALSAGHNGLSAFAPPTAVASPVSTAEAKAGGATIQPSPSPTTTKFLELQPIQIISVDGSEVASKSDKLPDNASQPHKTHDQAKSTPLSEVNEFVSTESHATSVTEEDEATTKQAVVLTIGSSAVTAGRSSEFIIASQTLTLGGQVTVAGTQLSLEANGGFAVLDGTRTQTLDATSRFKAPKAVFSFGSTTITADQSSHFVLGSETLMPGGEWTLFGNLISLATDGKYVVLDGTSTQVLATATPMPTQNLAITGSESTGASHAVVEYVVSSQTLRPYGPAITVDGTVLSLLPGASSVLVGSSTTAVSDLLPASTTSSANLGGIIAKIGGFTSKSESSSSKAANKAISTSAIFSLSSSIDPTMLPAGESKAVSGGTGTTTDSAIPTETTNHSTASINGRKNLWSLGFVLVFGVLCSFCL
jgi:hypothetical protein